MQDCFRQHPEVYGAELEDDDEPQSDAPAPSEAPAISDAPASSEEPATSEFPPTAAELDASSHPTEKQTRAKDVSAQMKNETVAAGENVEGESLIPKAAHDTEEKNQATKA
jgi:intermembrane space import and assembly protein 40